MSATDILEAITAVAVIAVAVFEVRQLRRHPRDPALRVLVPGLVLLAFTLTTSTPVWPLTVIDKFQDDSGLGNVIWVSMAWCYAAFFLFADRSRPTARRNKIAWVLGLGLAVAAAAHFWAALTRPLGPGRPPSFITSPTYYIFYVSCYGYALALFALGTVWAGLYLRRIQHRWLRVAVLLTILGASGMSLGVDLITLVRYFALIYLYPGQKFPWLTALYNTGRLGGQLLLAAGLLLAPIATVVYRARQRRDRSQRAQLATALDPLWKRLTSEFPFVVLTSDQFAGSFERRSAEITDALTRLAPYIPPAERVHGVPTTTQSADMIAAAFRARDHARAAGDVEDAWHQGPYPALEPDFGDDWRGRARWMRNLDEQLTERLVERLGEQRAAREAHGPQPTEA